MRIEREDDTSPDLSWLGEYSAQPGPCAVDRQERGDMGRNEYRYWNPGPNHAPHKPESWAQVTDRQVIVALKRLPKPWQDRAVIDIAWPDRFERNRAIAYLDSCYVEQDYQRHESFGKTWGTLGIIAKAEVQLASGSPIQTLRSGGLWGIESDRGADYFESVEKEELADLARELAAIGCTKRQIEAAYKKVERK